MKDSIKYLMLGILSISALASCSPSKREVPTSPREVPAYVLSFLKKNSYKVNLEHTCQVLKPGKYDVSTYIHCDYDLGYFYKGSDMAHSRTIQRESADMTLVDNKHVIDERTIKHINNPEETYYRDNKTGHAIYKSLNVQNELITQTQAIFDEEENSYVPILFDSEYANPFDSVTERDLVYDETTNTIEISSEKAYLILENYSAVGLNPVRSATLKLSDTYLPLSISFDIPDLEDNSGSPFTRTNESKVTFLELDSEYRDVKPFTHNNKKLASALTKYKNTNNFTYYKDYMYKGNVDHRISGFYTEDMIYYHHGEFSDGEIYKAGDNYDYVVTRDEITNPFYLYSYQTTDAIEWYWVQEYTGETPISYQTLKDCGPDYFNVSPAVFKDIGNNQYECESLVIKSMGSYFDYKCQGTTSGDLERNTQKCIVTLNNNDEIEYVDISFSVGADTFEIRYSYDNIGTTTIPSWLNFEI